MAPYIFLSVSSDIKYMVSRRCKMAVHQELERLGIRNAVVDLGLIEILDGITAEERLELKANLLKTGLELLDDKKSILIEK